MVRVHLEEKKPGWELVNPQYCHMPSAMEEIGYGHPNSSHFEHQQGLHEVGAVGTDDVPHFIPGKLRLRIWWGNMRNKLNYGGSVFLFPHKAFLLSSFWDSRGLGWVSDTFKMIPFGTQFLN